VREHPERLDINLGSVRQGGDWMHCNTVDYNAARDEVILTSNHLSEIYVIDHSTTTEEARGSTGGRHGKGGDFIYRWGNPQNYRRGTSADRVFYTAHGANWIRPGMLGAGDILVLNNGDRPGTSGDSSSVIQLTPPLDSSDRYYIHPDSAFGPSSPTWRYSNGRTFYSQHLGGAYRLPNGNTLAVLGTTGMVHEITPAHQVVWTLNTGGQVGRATKYPRDFASGAVEESPNCAVRSAKDRPTIVRGVLLLGAGHDPNVRHSGSCPKPVLLDAIGRTVLDLTPGANDLGRIAPGVYFVLAGGRFSRTLLVR